jgi:general stress protein YciG
LNLSEWGLTPERDKAISGTQAGGRKAAATNKKRYGENFYQVQGRKGGKISAGGWFSPHYVDPVTGKTGHDNAVEAGKKGGAAYRQKKQQESGQ